MNGVVEAVVLGALQGVAEWLPVSSQGITSMAARAIFGRSYVESLEVSIWLHAGTLVAALIYFRREAREIVAGFIRAGEGRGLLSFLIISTLSTAVTGLPLLLVIGHLPVPESVTTITIGSVLILMSLMGRVSGPPVENNLSGRKAFVAGLAQGLSIVPGVSRSGVTVIALLSQRLGLSTSLRLSFLMSIPATAAAQLALPIFVSTPELSPPSIISLLTATALGLLTIRTLLKISAHRSYTKVLTVLGVLAVLAGLVLLGGTL